MGPETPWKRLETTWNVNFSYLIFSYLNFSYLNFSYLNFSYLNFPYRNFSYLNFSYLNFSYINFAYLNFAYLNFSYAALPPPPRAPAPRRVEISGLRESCATPRRRRRRPLHIKKSHIKKLSKNVLCENPNMKSF